MTKAKSPLLWLLDNKFLPVILRVKILVFGVVLRHFGGGGSKLWVDVISQDILVHFYPLDQDISLIKVGDRCP